MKTVDEIIFEAYEKGVKNTNMGVYYPTMPEEWVFDCAEQYATQQVKAFQNDLKQFIQANPKATVKQILEHFNI